MASLLRAYRGLTVEATELIEEAAAVLAEAPDRWMQAFVDWVRSGLALKMGDAERAAELLRGSVAGFAEEGDRYGQAIASIRLGELAELRGDYDEAIALTTFAYEGTMSTGPGANASILATRLGNLAALQGRFDDAADVARDRAVAGPGVGLPGPGRAGAERHGGGRRPCRAASTRPRRLHREALAAYEAVGSVEGAAFTYACLGFLATKRGDVAGGHRAASAQPGQGGAGQRTAGDGPRRGRIGRRARASPGTARTRRGCSVSPPSCAATASCRPPWLLAERHPGRGCGQVRPRRRGATTRSHASGRQQADAIVARLVADARPSRAEPTRPRSASRTGSVPMRWATRASSGNSRRCSDPRAGARSRSPRNAVTTISMCCRSRRVADDDPARLRSSASRSRRVGAGADRCVLQASAASATPNAGSAATAAWSIAIGVG